MLVEAALKTAQSQLKAILAMTGHTDQINSAWQAPADSITGAIGLGFQGHTEAISQGIRPVCVVPGFRD